MGIFAAIIFYQSAIWAAAQLLNKLSLNGSLIFSPRVGALSIVAVGIGAGLLSGAQGGEASGHRCFAQRRLDAAFRR